MIQWYIYIYTYIHIYIYVQIISETCWFPRWTSTQKCTPMFFSSSSAIGHRGSTNWSMVVRWGKPTRCHAELRGKLRHMIKAVAACFASGDHWEQHGTAFNTFYWTDKIHQLQPNKWSWTNFCIHHEWIIVFPGVHKCRSTPRWLPKLEIKMREKWKNR